MEVNIASQNEFIRPTFVKGFWDWVQRAVKPRRLRRLRICETLSLGERRFLAVVEFDHQEFLVGGTGSSLSLLARMQDGVVVQEAASNRP